MQWHIYDLAIVIIMFMTSRSSFCIPPKFLVKTEMLTEVISQNMNCCCCSLPACVCLVLFVTYGETWVALLLSEQCYPLLSACYPLLSACYPLLSACAVLSLCPNNAAASEILTHTQMSTHAIAHGGCTDRARGCTGS